MLNTYEGISKFNKNMLTYLCLKNTFEYNVKSLILVHMNWSFETCNKQPINKQSFCVFAEGVEIVWTAETEQHSKLL